MNKDNYKISKNGRYKEQDKNNILENILIYVAKNRYSIGVKNVADILSVPSITTILSLFNTTWSDLRSKLDLDMKLLDKFNLTPDYLLLQQLKKTIIANNLATLFDYSFKKPKTEYAAIYYYRRFNIQSWQEFISNIDETLNKETISSKKTTKSSKHLTKEEVINIIQKKADELGRTPTRNEIDGISVRTYFKLFGSWTEALEEAGLKGNQINKYSDITSEKKKEILNNMRDRYKKKQGRLGTYNVETIAGCSIKTACRIFDVETVDELNEMLELKFPELKNLVLQL